MRGEGTFVRKWTRQCGCTPYSAVARAVRSSSLSLQCSSPSPEGSGPYVKNAYLLDFLPDVVVVVVVVVVVIIVVVAVVIYNFMFLSFSLPFVISIVIVIIIVIVIVIVIVNIAVVLSF